MGIIRFVEIGRVFKEFLVEIDEENCEFIQKFFLFLYLNSIFQLLGIHICIGD